MLTFTTLSVNLGHLGADFSILRCKKCYRGGHIPLKHSELVLERLCWFWLYMYTMWFLFCSLVNFMVWRTQTRIKNSRCSGHDRCRWGSPRPVSAAARSHDRCCHQHDVGGRKFIRISQVRFRYKCSFGFSCIWKSWLSQYVFWFGSWLSMDKTAISLLDTDLLFEPCWPPGHQYISGVGPGDQIGIPSPGVGAKELWIKSAQIFRSKSAWKMHFPDIMQFPAHISLDRDL
jgi:hypothetical protein